MSKEARLTRCKELYNQFLSLNPREFDVFPQKFSDFDGLSLEETKTTLHFVLDTLDGLNTNDAWGDLTWHAFTTLEGQIQNIYNSYAQLRSSRDQNSFQNFAQYIDAFAYHIRMFGIPFLSISGAYLEKTSASLSAELDRLIATRTEVEKLRDEVKMLITPAVAGSLSQAFTARKDILLLGRIIWGVIALSIGIYCIYATYGFASVVSNALTEVTLSGTKNEIIWLSVIIRSVILIPLYAAFGFSFTQYKKERDFEEEYAHKAAVATSLPNYGDLTREPSVRDQIVTGATNVIFSSPTSKHIEPENQEKVLDSVKNIFDSVSKLVSRKE